MQNQDPLSIVIPWFGRGSGGAEVYARGLACALQAAGCDVEIMTTCAADPFSDWATSVYPEGVEEVNGLRVRRFPPDIRDGDLYARLELQSRHGHCLSREEEQQWIENSINSQALVEHIGRHRAERSYLFLPYLYGLTYHGLQVAGQKGWLIPCLHNEGTAYFIIFDELFGGAAGVCLLSEPEMAFARSRFNLPAERCALIGGGIEKEAAADPARFRAKRGLERDYLLFVGRLVPGKGANLLLECYQRAAEELADPPDLVLIGAGDAAFAEGRAGVHAFGDCTREEVRDALGGCLALCQPSYYESFSLVLLEGWRSARPAIVNALCDVTRHHCLISGGGLWFSDSHQFRECVQWLQQHPERAARLGSAGRCYVQDRFTWPQTIDRLLKFVTQHAPQHATVR